MSFAFTSEYACENIANRVIRQYERKINDRSNVLIENLMPSLYQIARNRKVREPLRPLVKGIADRIARLDNCVWSRTEQLMSSLSPNEAYRVRAVTVAGFEDLNVLIFVHTNLIFSRKFIEITEYVGDVQIPGHALARYMYRERKDVSNFFSEIPDLLHRNTMISMAATCNFNDQIALPFGSGLLLGRIDMNAKDSKFLRGMRFYVSGDDADYGETEGPSVYERYRTVSALVTYVDDTDLTPARRDLRDELRAYCTKHDDLNRSFWMKHSFVRDADEKIDVPKTKFEASFHDAVDVVNGSAWTKLLMRKTGDEETSLERRNRILQHNEPAKLRYKPSAALQAN
jgi:hypothetical protein